MAEYSSPNDFGTPMGDDWLMGDPVGFLPPTSGLDGAFTMGGPSITAGGSLLSSFPHIAPGDYLLDPSIGSHGNAALGDVGVPPSQASSGRYFCDRPGCPNKEGFQRPSDLKRHQEKHEKRHQCTECTWRFGSKADKERHQKEVHGKAADSGKPAMHFCPEKSCKRNKRGFPRLWNMQQHFSKMHGGPLPSPLSSPATCSMDTPRFSSSGESAPTTPPSSMDEPQTPCPPTGTEQRNEDIMRGLIVSRLKELETQRQAEDREVDRLRALLREMETTTT